MNLTTNYNGKDISITLTKEQIAEIAKQTNTKTINDINGYLDACEVLNERPKAVFSVHEELNTIIRAINFIENNFKPWKPDFENTNEEKWFPRHITKNKCLVFHRSSCFYDCTYGQVGFSKSQKSSDLIGTKFIKQYQQIADTY